MAHGSWIDWLEYLQGAARSNLFEPGLVSMLLSTIIICPVHIEQKLEEGSYFGTKIIRIAVIHIHSPLRHISSSSCVPFLRVWSSLGLINWRLYYVTLLVLWLSFNCIDSLVYLITCILLSVIASELGLLCRGKGLQTRLLEAVLCLPAFFDLSAKFTAGIQGSQVINQASDCHEQMRSNLKTNERKHFLLRSFMLRFIAAPLNNWK